MPDDGDRGYQPHERRVLGINVLGIIEWIRQWRHRKSIEANEERLRDEDRE